MDNVTVVIFNDVHKFCDILLLQKVETNSPHLKSGLDIVTCF